MEEMNIEGFRKRMSNPEYKDEVMKNWKCKKKMQTFIKEHNILKDGGIEMGLELNKPKNEYNLTPEQRALLDKIVNDKFSVGAFSGMIFNAYKDGKGEIVPLIKDALDTRLLMQEMLE